MPQGARCRIVGKPLRARELARAPEKFNIIPPGHGGKSDGHFRRLAARAPGARVPGLRSKSVSDERCPERNDRPGGGLS